MTAATFDKEALSSALDKALEKYRSDFDTLCIKREEEFADAAKKTKRVLWWKRPFTQDETISWLCDRISGWEVIDDIYETRKKIERLRELQKLILMKSLIEVTLADDDLDLIQPFLE